MPTFKKANNTKSWWLSSLSTISFLVAACGTNKSLSLNQINAEVFNTPQALVNPQSQAHEQSLLAKAKAAPNPHDCKLGPQCYFQYINDRSMSLFLTSKTGSEVSSQFGTGWILDREVGTNNFYVISNIHVYNLQKEGATVQPDLISVQIGKQNYDPALGDNNKNVLLNYKDVKVDLKDWYQPNNRILPEVTSWQTTPSNSSNTTLGFNFVIKPTNNLQKYGSTILDPNDSTQFSDVFFQKVAPNVMGEVADDIDQQIRIDSPVHSDPLRSLFSAKRFSKFLSDEMTLVHKQGLEDAVNDNLYKMNLDFGSSHPELSKIIQDIQKEHSVKSFIDSAILKITIPDEILAHWFPYFLDPAKYNQYTFPHLATKNIYQLSEDQKKLTKFPLTDEQKKITFYHAGYPVEQLKRNLTYNSKGGPIFKTTTSNGDFMALSQRTPQFDHFKYDPKTMLDKGGDNHPPIGMYDIYTKDSNPTGGGSSGSMVIDKDYNAVAIYWGGESNGQVFSQFKEDGIQTPLYYDASDSLHKNFGMKWLTDFDPQLQDQLYFWFAIKYGQVYAHVLATSLYNHYKNHKTNSASVNGFRFGSSNPNDLFQDVNDYVSGIVTGHAETGSNMTDDQKVDRLASVFSSYLNVPQYSQLPSGHRLSFKFYDVYKNLIEGYYASFPKEFNNLAITFPGTTTLGTINLKQQLHNYFAQNHIPTYSLNNPATNKLS